MKKITLLISTLILTVNVFGQCPTEDIVLTSQAEIDNFATTYPNCTQPNFEIKINGETDIIDNLNGLSVITHAQDIFILRTEINDFTGLDNVVEIRNLTIWFNANIQNLDGFNSLQYSESLEMFLNNNLVDLSGLTNIQTIDNINLFENNNLTNLSHLSFLTEVNSFVLGGNGLNSLVGLENLHTVIEDFVISNEQLENFNDLESFEFVEGSLYLLNNESVTDISAFSNVESLENLYIIDCPNLQNLSGLQNIHTVGDVLRIGFNSKLLDLTVFSNISSVGNLEIYENENLISLRGLENLEVINNRLFIDHNPELIAIEQIENVDPVLIDEVIIFNNTSLSICNNELICAIIDDDSVDKTIALNNTGCNSVEEILAICLLGVEDSLLEEQFVIYPNPVSNILTINHPNSIEIKNVSVYTLLGQKLIETTDSLVDFSSYSDGMYFVEISTNQGTISKKIIKNLK